MLCLQLINLQRQGHILNATGLQNVVRFQITINFIYALKKLQPCPASIVMKLMNVQQNYAQRFSKPTELHPNQPINVGSRNRN